MESQVPKSQPLTCTADHQFLPLNKICVRPSCYSYCLMCDKCLKTYHSGPTHQVLTIDEYKQKFLSTLSQNSKNVDQKFVEGLKTSRKRLLQRLSEMQNSMASLIKKLRLAINNQFQTIIQSFSPDTYRNGLASWQQELTAKKIITTCYKIIVIRRNQFNGKLQNVLFSELQYKNKFQIATQKFKEIISEFQELKYVNQNTIIKPIPIKSPEQRDANFIAMDSQRPFSSISLKKKKKKNDKELIEIISSQSDKERSRGKKKNTQQINKQEPINPINPPLKQIIQQKQNITQNLNKSKTSTVIPTFTIQNIPWKKMNQSQVSDSKVQEIVQKSKISVPENKIKQKILSFPQKQENSQKQVVNNQKQSQKLSKNDQTLKKKGQENIKITEKILKINPSHGEQRQKNQMNKSLINMNSSNSNQNHSSTSYSLSAMKIRQQQGQSKKFDKTPEKIHKASEKIIQKKRQDVKHVPRPTQHKVPQKESISKQPILQKKSSSVVSSDIKTFQTARKEKQIKQKPRDPRNRTGQKITSGTSIKSKQPEKLKLPVEQIIYHQSYISYCGIKRPPKPPLTMKDEEIFEWFHANYPNGYIQGLVLSHKSVDGGKSYEYLLYFGGNFRWVTQMYLKEADQIPRLIDYWAANKIYQNRPKNQVK